MNQSLFHLLNNFAGKSVYFDAVIVFLAHYLPFLISGAVLLYPFFCRNDMKKFIGSLKLVFLTFASAIFAKFVVADIIRNSFYNPRPFEKLDGIYRLVIHSPDTSFPSSHATFFFAVAMAIWCWLPLAKINRWRSLPFFISAFLIGIFRIFAGVHWPADILAGALVGALSSLAIWLLLRKKIQ